MTWANDTTVPRCPHGVPTVGYGDCLDDDRPPETDLEPIVEERGLWIGCGFLALAFAAGVALGKWLP